MAVFKIDKSVIKAFDLSVYGEILSFEKEDLNGILKLEHCLNVAALTKFVRNKNFYESFNKSQGFLIHATILQDSVECMGLDTLKQVLEVKIDKSKDILIQLVFEATKSSTIFLKERDTSMVQNLSLDGPEPHLPLKQLFEEINFDSNLLTCEIDERTFSKFHDMRNISTLRFLKYFIISTKYEVGEKLLKSILADGTVEILKKFLNQHQGDVDFNSPNDNGDNLMRFVVENGKPEILEYLLRTSVDVDGKILSDYAWENKNYVNLLILLKYDSPFPKGFKRKNIPDISLRREFNALVNSRVELHDAIDENNFYEVKRFVDEHQDVKIGFLEDNTPALEQSLKKANKMNDFKIYAFLLSSRFKADFDCEYRKLKNKMTFEQNNMVSNLMTTHYGRYTTPHILYLCSRTKFAFQADARDEEKVKKLFETICAFEDIDPILQVLEHVMLTIVFDFTSLAVDKMLLNYGSNHKGIYFPSLARVNVGALNENKPGTSAYDQQDRAIAGTLAHELTHCAMKTLFDNSFKPFDPSDQKNMERFDKIIQSYKGKENHYIIELVYACYDKSSFAAELIVRVPHLLAYCKDGQGKSILETKYKSLYEYYNDVVKKRAREFIANPQKFLDSRKIQTLNQQFYVDIIQKKNLWLKKPEISFDHKDGLNVIVSNIPHLCMTNLYQDLQEKPSKSENRRIFVSLHDLNNEINRTAIFKVWKRFKESSLNVLLVVNCENYNENEDSKLGSIIEDREMAINLLLICGNCDNSDKFISNISMVKSNVSKFDYRWDDLTDETRQRLFETQINFQGNLIQLSGLIPETYATISALPLNNIINNSVLKIAEEIEISRGYDKSFYIERTLKINENGSDENLSTVDPKTILKKSEKDRMIVISDHAGMGKSTILTHLALKIKEIKPEIWIVKINLHEHVNKFKDDILSQLADAKRIKGFIYKHFAERKRMSFEKRLFFEFIDNQRIILMLDGFDEIIPFCGPAILTFISNVQKLLPTPIWITTRPHLNAEFERRFKVKCMMLEPFSYSDQINFLVKYWRNNLNSENKKESEMKLGIVAQKLITKATLSILDQRLELLAIPLQTRMIAEIYYDQISTNAFDVTYLDETLDVFTLYKKFIAHKTNIARNEKGEKVKNEITEKETDPLESTSFIDAHQQLALKKIFNINYNLSESQIQLVQRYGIVSVKNRTPVFIHLSFAEYFLATYVVTAMIEGTIESTHLKKNSLLLQILGMEKFCVVRNFIDDELLHINTEEHNIEKQKKFGRSLGHLYNEADNIYKSFMQIPVYERKIFLTDFLLTCLSHCNEKTLRKVLSQPLQSLIFNAWYNKSFGTSVGSFGISRDILYYITEKRFKSLMLKVWELVKKVFGKEAKSFFLKNYPTSKTLEYIPETYAIETMTIKELKQFYKSGRKQIEENSMNENYYIENCTSSAQILIANSLNLTLEEKFDFIKKFGHPLPVLDPRANNYSVTIRLAVKFITDLTPEIPVKEWIEFPWKNDIGQLFFSSFFDSISLNQSNTDKRAIELFETLLACLDKEAFESFTVVWFGLTFQYLKSIEGANKLYQIINANLSFDFVNMIFSRFGQSFFSEMTKMEIKLFNKVLSLYFATFSRNHLKLLILSIYDSQMLNIFQSLIFDKNVGPECLGHFLNLLKKNFDNADIASIIKQSANQSPKLLELTLRTKHNEKISLILNFLKTFNTKTENKHQITAPALYFAVQLEVTSFLEFFNFIEEILDKNEVRNLFRHNFFGPETNSLSLAKFKELSEKYF